jgi:hypothetical protein
MLVLGRTLAAARTVALFFGVASVLLVHRAASWVGAPRGAAFGAAALAAVIPTASVLGVSFQPEALAAGLVVLGAAATCMDGSRRWVGGVALGAATLCRYEAWPAATAFAAITLLDAARARRARAPFVLAAVVALVPAFAWVLHGVVHHHDALFFFHRVAAYRRALGVTESTWAALTDVPIRLVVAEPELVLGGIVAVVLARRARVGSARFARPALVLASILVFLVVGELVGGAPTHHPERTLLSIYLGGAIAVADAAGALLAGGAEMRTRRALVLAAAAAAIVVRAARPPEDGFVDRRRELAIGGAARVVLPSDERLAVDTPDFGYFAVIAAFGAPERAEPLDLHDPRDPPMLDAFANELTLRRTLASLRADALVTTAEHYGVAEPLGELVDQNATLALLKLAPRNAAVTP